MTSLPHVAYVVSVWLHILASMVWIGGMAFLVLVLAPPLRQFQPRELAADLLHRTGLRFRTVGWICLGVLVATGMVNLYLRGIRWTNMTDPAFWRTPFGSVLFVKLHLVGILLVLSGIHDFVIGPRATAALRREPLAPETRRLRRWSSVAGRIAFILAVLVVLLGDMLVRGRPF